MPAVTSRETSSAALRLRTAAASGFGAAGATTAGTTAAGTPGRASGFFAAGSVGPPDSRPMPSSLPSLTIVERLRTYSPLRKFDQIQGPTWLKKM